MTRLDVKSGSNTDVVLHQPASVNGAPVVSTYRTPLSPIGPEKARVLLAHTATVAPADVRVDGKVVFTNIANGEYADADVPAGPHRVALLPTGFTNDPILGPLTLTLPPRTVTMVYAVGNPRTAPWMPSSTRCRLRADGSGAPRSIDTGSAGRGRRRAGRSVRRRRHPAERSASTARAVRTTARLVRVRARRAAARRPGGCGGDAGRAPCPRGAHRGRSRDARRHETSARAPGGPIICLALGAGALAARRVDGDRGTGTGAARLTARDGSPQRHPCSSSRRDLPSAPARSGPSSRARSACPTGWWCPSGGVHPERRRSSTCPTTSARPAGGAAARVSVIPAARPSWPRTSTPRPRASAPTPPCSPYVAHQRFVLTSATLRQVFRATSLRLVPRSDRSPGNARCPALGGPQAGPRHVCPAVRPGTRRLPEPRRGQRRPGVRSDSPRQPMTHPDDSERRRSPAQRFRGRTRTRSR